MRLAAALLVGGLLAASADAGLLEQWESEPRPWALALEEGRWDEARRLLASSEEKPLVRGEGLLALGDPEAALAALGSPGDDDPVAAVLAARAVLASPPEPERDAEIEARLARVAAGDVGEVVAAQALRDRIALLERLERGEDLLVAAVGIPEGDRSDRERWWIASALAEPVAAHRAFLEIWRTTPASPWALEARRRARELEEEHPELTPPPLSVVEREELARRLQKAGHHAATLELIEELESEGAGPERPGSEGRGPSEEALYLRAGSAYRLRRDELCIEAADAMSTRFPDARLLPRTMVFALRSLRRTDRTEEIRRRALWLAAHRPGDAAEVLFQLGDHLGNVRDPAEGLAILDRVAASKDSIAAEALWKGAWLARRLDDTPGARRRLADLTSRFAGSGWEPAALYWLGRWEPDPERAASTWRGLIAVDPEGYYGRLARERAAATGMELGLPALAPPASFPPARPRREPALERARRWVDRGLASLAVLELESLQGRDPALELTRARLEARAGRPERAAAIAESSLRVWLDRRPPGRDDPLWRLALPLWPRPETFAGSTTLDPFLVLGLVRQESRFRADAVSPVGALGLLQLMPETAAAIARDLGLASPGRRELFDPVLNLRLGLVELERRIEGHGGAVAPAIASYNAGAAAVGPWWASRPATMELDEWIETIPYGETRVYVKKVLENWALYHQVWAEPVEILDRLRRDARTVTVERSEDPAGVKAP